MHASRRPVGDKVHTEKVAALVKGLSRDADSVRSLRSNPPKLVKQYRLTSAHREALADVDRFFKTEQPIVPTPSPPRVPAVRQRIQVLPRAGTLSASADTGTLLPGPNTGTYTNTGTISITAMPLPPAAASGTRAKPQCPWRRRSHRRAPSAPMLPMPAPRVRPLTADTRPRRLPCLITTALSGMRQHQGYGPSPARCGPHLSPCRLGHYSAPQMPFASHAAGKYAGARARSSR